MSSDEKTQILPQVAEATVGTQLSGIYELDERIAFGGMGEVYRGHNIQTGDPVAIKIVLPELARDPTILSLFRKEASILNHLAHDAIVRYHVFTIDAGIGRPYLAMEFVDGESLVDLMKRGPMSADQARKLCARLASGLAAAHEAGIVHRDLSPDNIILPGGRVERAKIIDFGIARSATVGGETLIGGKFAGKYNYVSPEQLGLFGAEITEQSDISSLGLEIAATLLAEPIDMGGTQVEIVEKRRVVPDLSGIDESIRPILEAMLQPRPQDRPASMAAVAEMARGVDVTALPRTVPPAADPVAQVPPPAADPVPTAASWPTPEPVADAAPQPAPELSPPPEAGDPPASGGEAPPFVAHVRPAWLDEKREGTPVSGPPPKQRTGKAAIVAIAASLVVMLGGAALYMSGVLEPSTPESAQPGQTETVLTPEPSAGTETTTDQSAAGQPADDAGEAVARVEPPAAAATTPPATESQPVAEPPPAEAPLASEPAPAQPPAAAASDPAAPVQPATPQAPTQQPQPEPAVTEAALQPAAAPPATEALDDVARRISWVRDYSGGDCFYATALAATDKAIEIEGFGTDVQPFMQLLTSFQNEFRIEPDVGVRLIEQPQCVVANFLRDLPRSSAGAPDLTLDRTSVPNGTPVSGRLTDLGGRKPEMLLIDHKGMAFNLNSRLSGTGDGRSFSVPIGLSAADQAARKVVPQMIIVLASAGGIKAAEFSAPVPAADVLPKILDEMRSNGDAAATAKYFRLGG